MNWLAMVIMLMVAATAFAAWRSSIRKNQRSELLSKVAGTGSLQDVKNLAEKLGIILVHHDGFSRRRKNLHQLVWPEALGKFTCSLLKAKEDDPEFEKYIRGIAGWLFDHCHPDNQRLFIAAMNRHPNIADKVSAALFVEMPIRDAAAYDGRSEQEEKRRLRRQLRAWGVKPGTSSEEK